MVPIKIDECFNEHLLRKQLALAQCGMSGVRVAACLIAENKLDDIKAFYASNIELARGKVYHAEEAALIKSINEGYTNPIAILLTANHEKYLVPLCYACRAVFAYVNPKCVVFVLNNDMSTKTITTIHDSMRYHYESHGFIS